MSASSSTTIEFLPPSSRATRLSPSPAARATARPASVEPVNDDHGDVGIGHDRRTGTGASGQDVEQPFGQSGFLEQPRHDDAAGHRRVGIGFEQDGVAQHKGGREGPHGEQQGSVPGVDDADHTQRYPPRVAGLAGCRRAQDLAVRQRGEPGGLRQLAESGRDLVVALRRDASGLPDDPLADGPAVVAQCPGGTEQHLGALLGCRLGPGPLSPGGQGTRPGDIRGLRHAHLRQPLSRGGFVHRPSPAPGLPPAAAVDLPGPIGRVRPRPLAGGSHGRTPIIETLVAFWDL